MQREEQSAQEVTESSRNFERGPESAFPCLTQLAIQQLTQVASDCLAAAGTPEKCRLLARIARRPCFFKYFFSAVRQFQPIFHAKRSCGSRAAGQVTRAFLVRSLRKHRRIRVDASRQRRQFAASSISWPYPLRKVRCDFSGGVSISKFISLPAGSAAPTGCGTAGAR